VNLSALLRQKDLKARRYIVYCCGFADLKFFTISAKAILNGR